MQPLSSSWTKCVSGLSYPLQVPTWFRLAIGCLLSFSMVISLSLTVDWPIQLLLWLFVYRSYVLLFRHFDWCLKAKLFVDEDGRLNVIEEGGVRWEPLRIELRARYFYWIHLNLSTRHGKPMEILIFSRYDQRQNYRRLVRYLAQS